MVCVCMLCLQNQNIVAKNNNSEKKKWPQGAWPAWEKWQPQFY